MSDPLPPMTASEARLALEGAVKPFRPLLDLTRILDAAVAAETAAQDDAEELARRTAALERAQADLDKAKAQADEVRAENVQLIDATNAKASEILHAADAKAKADAEETISAAVVKAVEIDAQVSQATERLAALTAEAAVVGEKLAKATADCAAAEGKLAEIKAAIAKITGA